MVVSSSIIISCSILATITMSDLPFIDRSGLTFLSAAGIALATALTSISAFFHCDYIQYRSHQDWTTSAGYTKAQFIALFIGTYA